MTKKSKDNQKSTEVEKMTPALLMRSWNKTMEGVKEAKELNRQSGVPNAENFIQWPGYIPVKKYLNFIEATVNESTGEFRTLDNLIAAGEIQKSELKFYPKTYPNRELHYIVRYQDYDTKEWIIRFEFWEGLSKTGAIIPLGVSDLDYYKEFNPEPILVDVDPNSKHSRQARVKFMERENGHYANFRKIYWTPFSEPRVIEAMSYVRRNPPIQFAFHKEGATNSQTVPDLDTFIHADFTPTWNKFTAVTKPSVNVDATKFLKDLHDELIKHERDKMRKDDSNQSHYG